MRALLPVAGAIVMFGSPAAAEDWRIVTADDYSAIALETSGLRVSPSRTIGWVAIVLPQSTDNVDYFLVRYEWNCTEYSHVQTSLASYSADGMMVVRSDNRRQSEVVAPGTNADKMMDAVCQNIYQFDDPEGWETVSGLMTDYRSVLP